MSKNQFYKVLIKLSNNDTNLIIHIKWNNLEKKEFENIINRFFHIM